jgi:sugar phosphate isomerase/epimerase
MSDEMHSLFAVNTYSYTLDFDVQDCLSRLAHQGFAEFELMMYPGHLWPPALDAGEGAALARWLSERNFKVRTLNQPNVDINLAGATEEMRAYSLALVRATVELAGELGADGVVIGPGKGNPLFPAPVERMTGWFFEALDMLLPVARRAGTRLLVENMPFCFLPDADGMMAALERYGAEEIGVVYDVANAHFIGEDLVHGFARVAPRLHTVHLSDTGRQVYKHDPVGHGDLDFAAALAGAKAVGHERVPILEIISTDPDTAIPDSAARLARMGWDAVAS